MKNHISNRCGFYRLIAFYYAKLHSCFRICTLANNVEYIDIISRENSSLKGVHLLGLSCIESIMFSKSNFKNFCVIFYFFRQKMV